MSEKDKIIQLLDYVPEYKLGYVLAYVQGITADEDSDDEYCRKLYEEYLNDTDRKKRKNTLWRNVKRNGGLPDVSDCPQKKAKKFIDKLPIAERKRIVTAIGNLPYGEDIKRLQGYENVLRLRVGTYRIIYTVDHGKLIVTVIDAGNRGQIYKRL